MLQLSSACGQKHRHRAAVIRSRPAAHKQAPFHGIERDGDRTAQLAEPQGEFFGRETVLAPEAAENAPMEWCETEGREHLLHPAGHPLRE